MTPQQALQKYDENPNASGNIPFMRMPLKQFQETYRWAVSMLGVENKKECFALLEAIHEYGEQQKKHTLEASEAILRFAEELEQNMYGMGIIEQAKTFNERYEEDFDFTEAIFQESPVVAFSNKPSRWNRFCCWIGSHSWVDTWDHDMERVRFECEHCHAVKIHDSETGHSVIQ